VTIRCGWCRGENRFEVPSEAFSEPEPDDVGRSTSSASSSKALLLPEMPLAKSTVGFRGCGLLSCAANPSGCAKADAWAATSDVASDGMSSMPSEAADLGLRVTHDLDDTKSEYSFESTPSEAVAIGVVVRSNSDDPSLEPQVSVELRVGESQIVTASPLEPVSIVDNTREDTHDLSFAACDGTASWDAPSSRREKVIRLLSLFEGQGTSRDHYEPVFGPCGSWDEPMSRNEKIYHLLMQYGGFQMVTEPEEDADSDISL